MMTGLRMSVDEAMTVDEVGMTFARHGDFLFKAAYQPVHVLVSDTLHPWAVEGSVRAVRVAAATQQTQAALPIIQDTQFALFSLALQIRNFHDMQDHVDRLLLNLDLASAFDLFDALGLLRFVAVELLRADIDPRRVIVVLRDGEEPEWLPEFVDSVRLEGMNPALQGFGLRHVVGDQVVPGQRAFARFDARWLRRVCSKQAALRLLGLLVERMRGSEIEPIAPGIDDPALLSALIGAGFTHLSGPLICGPALAGTFAGPAEVPLARLLPAQGQVVPIKA